MSWSQYGHSWAPRHPHPLLTGVGLDSGHWRGVPSFHQLSVRCDFICIVQGKYLSITALCMKFDYNPHKSRAEHSIHYYDY